MSLIQLCECDLSLRCYINNHTGRTLARALLEVYHSMHFFTMLLNAVIDRVPRLLTVWCRHFLHLPSLRSTRQHVGARYHFRRVKIKVLRRAVLS